MFIGELGAEDVFDIIHLRNSRLTDVSGANHYNTLSLPIISASGIFFRYIFSEIHRRLSFSQFLNTFYWAYFIFV